MPDLTPTEGMREEARRYREWKAEGRKGGTSVAARRASQILSGKALSPKTVQTMAAWFARHEVDKQGQGFSPDEDGYPSPGRVAWAAWGGDAGQSWANAKAESIANAADRMTDEVEASDMEREITPDLKAHQVALYESLEEIADEIGSFDKGIGASGAHYMEQSPFADQGIVCANCNFFAGPRGCEIVEGDIAPEGACKFWIVPEGLMTAETAPPVEPMADRAKPGEVGRGDFVSWSSSGGAAKGRIERIATSGSIDVPNSDFSVSASEEDPAALIRVFSETADGWKPTETLVGHRLSTLNKIEALRSMEGKYTRAEVTAFSEVEDRTFEFPFSSEYPVARYFGNEVLSHDPQSADLARLNDGAPLLFNHNPDKVVGVVERAWIDGQKKRGYVKVRFSRNAFAKEVMADVKDGVLRGVSFGYAINKMEERGDNFVATEWSPYEVSVCSIAADPTIGVGRSLTDESAAPVASPTPQEPEVHMENTPDVEVIRSKAVEAERTRIATITAIGEKHGLQDLARELIEGGRSVDEARAAVLDKLDTRSHTVEHRIADDKANDLGLSEKETKQFSFVRALNFLANQGDRKARELAAFEIEVGEAAAKKYERSSNGIVVPNEVLRRDLVVGTSTAGGNLVTSELLSGSFIELLRNRMAMMQAGVTMLTGLQGNIAIPRQSSSATAYWVGEGGSPTESQQAIDQVNMTPKTVGAFVDYSRRLLLQSSIDVEGMIRADLARVIALELDRAAIYGTGSTNQPLGLTNTTGIGSQAITTYGTFAEYIGMETDVATANADAGALRYIINAAARGALKSTEKSATSTAQFVYMDDQINGYPVIVSNQLANNDCLFGDFSQFVVGMWSGLDLTVDPFAGATAGTVRIIALQDVDFAVKQPGAFCFGT